MRRRILPSLSLFLLSACATYHPHPLDRAAVVTELQPPPPDSVSIAAAKLHNPLLAELEFDPSNGLTADEAAVLAVVANPELRAARTRNGVARAQLIAAGVLPNPQLSASADVPVHNDTGESTATGLGLSFDLNPLFARGPERAAARAQEQSVRLDVAWQEWQVAQKARLQTYRLLFLQRQLEVARKEAQALRSNRDQLDRAVTEHLVTEAERAAAADAFRTAVDTRLQLEGEAAAARLELARVLGRPPSTPIAIQDQGVPFLSSSTAAAATDSSAWSLPELFDTPDDSLLARLERHRLDLVALRMGYESQEQSLRAAVRRSFPSISLGINRLMDTSKVLTWGPAIALDLPFFQRNQGEIAIGRATREQLRAEYLSRVFEARADVADLREQIQSTGRRLRNAEESMPELARLVDVYGQALKLGTTDALLYYAARSRRTEMELEVLRLQQNLAELTVGLETATGRLWTPARAEDER